MAHLVNRNEWLPLFQELVHLRVCRYCVDRKEDGTCGLSNPPECSLHKCLPKIVDAVFRIESDSIEDYVQSVREEVCEGCANQKLDGYCPVREQVRCALDRYLPLIVGAIEEGESYILERGVVLPHS